MQAGVGAKRGGSGRTVNDRLREATPVFGEGHQIDAWAHRSMSTAST